MSLVPYLVTSLSRNDITESPKDRNVVIGAIVEFRQGGVPQNIYDDAAGSNPATQKVTDSNGQLNAWVEPGIYDLLVNGVGKSVIVSAEQLTGAEIATLYEDEPNTNKLTDADKNKISTALQPSDVGTAAFLDATTNSLDGTPNRVLKVGAFGVGAQSGGGSAPQITDFKQLHRAGLYDALLSTAANGPDTIAYQTSVLAMVTESGMYYQVTRVTSNPNALRSWIGIYSSSTDSIVWSEVYHALNTNLYEFGGGGTNQVLATGVANQSNQAIFIFNTSSYSSASSLTFSSSATFKVVTANFAGVAAGITPSSIGLTGGRSGKSTTIIVSGLTGLTIGQILYILVDSSGSKITVNF